MTNLLNPCLHVCVRSNVQLLQGMSDNETITLKPST